MADTKISLLPALGGAPAADDLIPIDDVSAGATKSMTVANVAAYLACYGEIYCADASTTQTTNATPSTFDKVTGFTTDGSASNVTVAAASDKITLTRDGKYQVYWTCAFYGSNNVTFDFRLYDATNAAAYANIATHRKLNASGDAGSCSMQGIISVSGSTDIIVQVEADGASKSFTPQHMNLTVRWLGA